MSEATQQPDPFSELRGLMERARYVLELDEKWGNFSAYTNVSRQLFKDMTATLDQVQPLLDERDRLISALREVEEAAVVDENAYRNEATITGVGEIARQALSQEIG